MNRVMLRFGALRESLRGSLWFLPTVSVVVALVAGVGLARVTVDPEGVFGSVVFGGGAGGARGVLQVIAGSIITVTSVTFSLTVVALTTVASQYSPRVLRTFLRDRANQTVLSTFLATFAFSLIVLRTIRAGEGDEVFVPRLALTVALLLSLASIAGLVYFIHHITQSIRVQSILSRVQRETMEAVRRLYGDDPEPSPVDVAPWPVPAHALTLPAATGGYLQSLAASDLLEFADAHDLLIAYRRGPGERVTAGTVLAWAWHPTGTPADDIAERLAGAVRAAVQIGKERTMQADIAFGLRQLVDIAIKALSPSVNDPTTAGAAMGEVATVVCALAGRPLGPKVHNGAESRPRVLMPRPSFSELLGLACAQPALYGASDVTFLRDLFRLLTDLAEVAPTQARRQETAAAIDAVLARALDGLESESDRAEARRSATAARAALRGALEPPIIAS
ncbi:MAG: DUF2254 domain-containing protein [Egibacteraceae bacterium]